jgi:hypothetical protein
VKAATARTSIVVALISAVALAACGAGAPATVTPTIEPSPSPAEVSQVPSLAPSPTPAAATSYTADDTQIAALMTSISADATKALNALKDMDLNQQLAALTPVQKWVNARKAEVNELTPSDCTQAAVLLFFRGLDKYSDIAEKFLAWREWGVIGDPYPRNMPMQAADYLKKAQAELTATCPG